MRELLNGMTFIPVAAVLTVALYLPFFLRLRKREGYPFLRHLANFTLMGYFVMLAWVTLTGAFFVGYGDEIHNFNLCPFSEFVRPYMQDEGMYLSQAMLNIIMFVPYGFLLPVVFPRRAGRFYKSALIVLATTAAIECAQYFIGRAADIDDIIANFTGGVSGYALYALASAAFHKAKWFKRLLPGYSRARALSLALAALALAAVFLLPAALDVANEKSEYGLFREVTQSIPANATLNIETDDAAPASAAVYADERADAPSLAKSVAALLCPGAELEYSQSWNEYYGTTVSAHSVDASKGDYDVYANEIGGIWSVHMPLDEAVAAMSGAQLEEYARDVAALFLREGESIEGVSHYLEDESRLVNVTFKSAPGEYISGSMSFSQYNGERFSINSNVTRCVLSGTVDVISEAEALRAARGVAEFNAFDYEKANVVINGVKLVTIERKGKRIPAYEFSGESDYPDGIRGEWICYVDAVKR